MEQFQLKLITTNIDCQQCQASNATKPPKRSQLGWLDAWLVGWMEARLVSCCLRCTLGETAVITSAQGVTQCRSESCLRGGAVSPVRQGGCISKCCCRCHRQPLKCGHLGEPQSKHISEDLLRHPLEEEAFI